MDTNAEPTVQRKIYKQKFLLITLCIVSLISAFLFCLINLLLLSNVSLFGSINNIAFLSDTVTMIDKSTQLAILLNIGITIVSAFGVIMILKQKGSGLLIYCISKVFFVGNVFYFNSTEGYTLSFLFRFSIICLMSLIMILFFSILAQRKKSISENAED
jgi:hypothetical protein